MTQMFTLDDVREGLRKVVAGREGHVYEPPADLPGPVCAYVHGDEPGCVIGQYLASIGVPLDVLRDCDQLPTSGIWSTAVRTELTRAGFMFEPQALSYMVQVQNAQDHGTTWGEALEEAEARLHDRPGRYE